MLCVFSRLLGHVIGLPSLMTLIHHHHHQPSLYMCICVHVLPLANTTLELFTLKGGLTWSNQIQ